MGEDCGTAVKPGSVDQVQPPLDALEIGLDLREAAVVAVDVTVLGMFAQAQTDHLLEDFVLAGF